MNFSKFFAACLFTAVLSADIFVVPDSLASIQIAVDSASTGDTVLVTSSFANEGRVSITGKQITLVSQQYLNQPDNYNPLPGASIFYDDSLSSLISLQHADSTRIMGFLLDSPSASQSGGGIEINESQDVVFRSVYIRNNPLFIQSSTAHFFRGTFKDANLSDTLISAHGSGLNLMNTLIENNVCRSLLALENSSFTMENSIIWKNSVLSLLTLQGSTVNWNFSTVLNNSIATPLSCGLESFLSIKNSIVYEPFSTDNTNMAVSYSCVPDSVTGDHLLLEDPLCDTLDTYPVLTEYSPCFASADPDTSDDHYLSRDFSGSLRPDPLWSPPDCGALESGRYKQSNADHRFWVSESGNDIWGNGTVDNPFLSLQSAFDACADGDTVFVEDGTIVSAAELSNKSLTLASRFLLDGDTTHIKTAIITADSSRNRSILACRSVDSIYVTGLSFSGGTGEEIYPGYSYGGALYLDASTCHLNNVHFTNNHSDFSGGAIYALNYSTLYADSVKSDSNFSYLGGALALSSSTAYLTYSEFLGNGASSGGAVYANNQSQIFCFYTDFISNSAHENYVLAKDRYPGSVKFSGGALFASNSNCYMSNSLAINNSAENNGYAIYQGGGYIKILQSTFADNLSHVSRSSALYLSGTWKPCLILNSIFSQSDSADISLNNADLDIAYTALVNDSASIANKNSSSNIFRTNLIYGDPQLQNDNTLSPSSDCIDAGTDEYIFDHHYAIHYSDSFYAGTAPDLGRFGANPPVSFVEEEFQNSIFHENPVDSYLLSAYPNPFNPNITITFSIAETEHYRIGLFNARGQKVHSVADRIFRPGTYSIELSFPDLPSGIYICTLRGKKKILTTRKIILLK